MTCDGVEPDMKSPDLWMSICRIVGLVGDLNNLTLFEGRHGYAVTKFTSFFKEIVVSISFSMPS